MVDITSPYHWYEFTHAALSPARVMADATRLFYKNPLNPLSQTPFAKNVTASLEVFERVTRRYGKPSFGLPTTFAGGERVKVIEEVLWERPFCSLLHFRKALSPGKKPGPKVLLVAPMSGHYATLLRGTVEAFLPDHDVYITDWTDARMVPMAEGRFDLDDYIDYIANIFHYMGGDCHVVAVCQPSVPVLAAIALMEERGDPYVPHTMTLMGGPIDTRANPTAVNELAENHDIEWFHRNVIMKVPFPHPGMLRDVYPGFLQLSGFMSMNLDRHVAAHRELFRHLVDGDGDSAEKHRDFYDEYLAVMDLTAEFYLQTIDTVFIKHSLPKREMTHRGHPVDCSAIRNVALFTVEGEKDDISGLGQTKAAHKLCSGLPDEMKMHYMQPRVGHYGVFNGSRFRSEIMPRIADFMRSHQAMTASAQAAKAKPAPAPAAAKMNGNGAAEPAPAKATATATKEAATKEAAAKPAAPQAAAAQDTAKPKEAAATAKVAERPAPKAEEAKAPQPKAAEPKPAEPKAAEPKAAEPKTAEPKTADAKTADAKTADAKAAEPKAKEAKPAEAKAAEAKTAEARPAASAPAKATAGSKANSAVPASALPHLKRGILLDEPHGAPDDLTQIKGIGPKLSVRLNDHGIYHFWQIAELDEATSLVIEKAMGFPGKIGREKWIDQARNLSSQTGWL